MGNEDFFLNVFPLKHCACIFDHITISLTWGNILLSSFLAAEETGSWEN